MALIAALLPDSADRASLTDAVPEHRTLWANDWRELLSLVRQRPVATAVADLHAERRKDGVLRVYRFAERYPLTPLLVWGELDGRDLFRLGKAGASDVVVSRDGRNAVLVAETLESLLSTGVRSTIDERLRGRIGEEGRQVVAFAAERITDPIQVPDLADAFDVSVSTLERRCEEWGLPTPGRLLLWLRVLHGLHWLIEPGRSVESVAAQLGYSSGAALRRAIKASVGGRPSPLRSREGLERALTAFLAECPGDRAYQRLSATG